MDRILAWQCHLVFRRIPCRDSLSLLSQWSWGVFQKRHT